MQLIAYSRGRNIELLADFLVLHALRCAFRNTALSLGKTRARGAGADHQTKHIALDIRPDINAPPLEREGSCLLDGINQSAWQKWRHPLWPFELQQA